jgi:hypothetical protein
VHTEAAFQKKPRPVRGGACRLTINLDVDTGTRPSDLNIRLADAAPLLDNDIAAAGTPADREVAVPVDAFLAA